MLLEMLKETRTHAKALLENVYDKKKFTKIAKMLILGKCKLRYLHTSKPEYI